MIKLLSTFTEELKIPVEIAFLELDVVCLNIRFERTILGNIYMYTICDVYAFDNVQCKYVLHFERLFSIGYATSWQNEEHEITTATKRLFLIFFR